MADDAVIELRATSVKLAADMQQGAAVVNSFANDVRRSGAVIGDSFKEASGATGGLFGSMKELRGEARQHERVFNYFGSQLAGLTGVTKGFGSEIVGLGVSLASSMWAVAAIEGIKLVTGAFQESGEAAKKMAEEAEKALVKMAEEADKAALQAEKLRLEYAGFTSAMITMATSVAPARMALEDLTDAADRQRAALATLRAERAAAIAQGMEGGAQDDGSIERAEKVLADLENKIAHQRAILESRTAASSGQVDVEQRTSGIEAAKKEKEERAKIGRESAAADWQFEVERAAAEVKVEADKERELQQMWKEEGAEDLRNKRAAWEQDKKIAAEMTKIWTDAGKTMGTAIGSAFADMITKSKTVGQAMAAMGKSILMTVIDTVAKQIEAYVLGAEAAAAFSQAGIPVVGPILAVAAVAGMAALLGGLVSSMPSAATGWDRVPYDMPVMVHQGEKITPKYDVDRQDALLARAAGGGGTTINIATVDAKSVRRLLLDNDDVLAEAIRRARKNGRI